MSKKGKVIQTSRVTTSSKPFKPSLAEKRRVDVLRTDLSEARKALKAVVDANFYFINVEVDELPPKKVFEFVETVIQDIIKLEKEEMQ